MPRKRPDGKTLLASLGIAIGVVLIIAGFRSSTTGREQLLLPAAIESTDPILGATQIPQQSPIFVDMVPGYDMVLTIDGVELPTTDIATVTQNPDPGQMIELPKTAIIDYGRGTITYTPTDGGPVEAFESGLHTVQLLYWKIDEGRVNSRTYTWSFNAV